MMKIFYKVRHICDGCHRRLNDKEEKMTRKVDKLDIRHPDIDHYLCRDCDRSTLTTSAVCDYNRKMYGLGDPFGLKKGNRRFIIFT